MRIGVVTTSYPRGAGDPAGSFVAEHVAWLRRRGVTVEVVAAGDGSPAAGDAIRVTSPLFYRGGAPEALEAGWRALPAAVGFSARTALAVATRARRWDGVIAHWLAPSALVASLASRAPLVAIAHSGDVHLLCRLGLAAPVAALLRARGASIVFVSRALRQQLADAVSSARLARWVRAMPVCPMGVDLASFAELSRPAAPTRRRVVFLGRLVPIKGVDVLIRAAALLAGDARVVIAGDGPERERLRALAGDRVQLVGEVRGAQRDRLLAGADVVALPSVPRPDGRTEGTPRVALEAMAAGAAVVASATGGLAELPAAAISRVAPGNPAALAQAIDRLLGDPALRRRQVDAGRAVAAQHDWQLVGPRLVEPLRIFQ